MRQITIELLLTIDRPKVNPRECHAEIPKQLEIGYIASLHMFNLQFMHQVKLSYQLTA